MNKNQWFALGFIFLGTMIFFFYLDIGNNNIYDGYSTNISAYEIHIAVFDAIVDGCIVISFLLSNACWILGWLENGN